MIEMAIALSANPPVVGILTMPDEHKKFRGNRKNFIDIIDKGKEHGVTVYVVTTDHLRLDRDRVLAYGYEAGQRQWNPQWIPLPDVIYNRIPYREDEQREEVRQLIAACLRDPDVKLFNPYFFNKWELFRWLNRSRITRRLIPMTRKYSRKLKLLPILKRHSLLYLKPQSGKAGNGIMSIRRKLQSKLPYRLTIQETKKSQTFRFSSLPELRRHLNELIGEEDYIVQQGVHLSTVGGRPFDLRVLVQKNRKGQWTLTGIGARLAGESSITTHVPRGGSIEDPRRLLAASFGASASKRIMKRISLTAVSIAKQIERRSGHSHGEMSMDLGIDQTGHLWFFEANSKPMKFDEADIRDRSLQAIIDYSRYLARRNKKPRGGSIAR